MKPALILPHTSNDIIGIYIPSKIIVVNLKYNDIIYKLIYNLVYKMICNVYNIILYVLQKEAQKASGEYMWIRKIIVRKGFLC